ncbi:hypothetical protein CCP4SC76_3720001 [Gammaproteobacteria bacterium]
MVPFLFSSRLGGLGGSNWPPLRHLSRAFSRLLQSSLLGLSVAMGLAIAVGVAARFCALAGGIGYQSGSVTSRKGQLLRANPLLTTLNLPALAEWVPPGEGREGNQNGREAQSRSAVHVSEYRGSKTGSRDQQHGRRSEQPVLPAPLQRSSAGRATGLRVLHQCYVFSYFRPNRLHLPTVH